MEYKNLTVSDRMDKMDKDLKFKNVVDLLNLAEQSSDPSDESDESPTTTRSGALRGGLRKGYDAVAEAFASLKKSDGDDKKVIQTVINSVVNIVSDLVKKVNAQGELLKVALESMNKKVDTQDIEEKFEQLQTEVKNREKDFKVEKEKLEKEFESKLECLDIKCDEGRQREMKGTLIVSSPVRGTIGTEAFPRSHFRPDTGAETRESELDVVLRMVQEKTGVRFHHTDIMACHRIGKRDSHSFVLRIGNRRPNSAWDMLTLGMKNGKTFSNQNIFINFMLTTRRTEISKQVRKAKKDGLKHCFSTWSQCSQIK